RRIAKPSGAVGSEEQAEKGSALGRTAMQTLLEYCLSNAAVAMLLALVAALSQLIRRPALSHGLWLLVLIKLLTPPILPLPIRWPSRPALAVHDSTASAAPTEALAVRLPSPDPATRAGPVSDRGLEHADLSATGTTPRFLDSSVAFTAGNLDDERI